LALLSKLIAPLVEEVGTDVLKKEAGAVASKVVKPTPLISKTTTAVSRKQLEQEAASAVDDVLGIAPKPKAVEQTATALAKKKPAAVIPDIPLSSTKRPVFQPTSTSKVVKDEGPYLGEVEREGRFVDNGEPVLAKQEEAAPTPASEVDTPSPMEDNLLNLLKTKFESIDNSYGKKVMLQDIIKNGSAEQKAWASPELADLASKQYDLWNKYREEGYSVGEFLPEKPFYWSNPEKQEYEKNPFSFAIKPAKDEEGKPLSGYIPPNIPEAKIKKGSFESYAPYLDATPDKRKGVLFLLREERGYTFKNLIENPQIAGLSDAEDVLAVVQGNFRKEFGKEIDPKNTEDIAAVITMAQKSQSKLDSLRKKYADEPPIKLFHGREASKTGENFRYKTGYTDPQQIDKYHAELKTGGTSFTRDPNLNMESPVFGGPNPQQIIYTEIPYADFMFKRVNMNPKEYSDKNLDVIAQTINGSDRVVRPLSLPRSNFKETEEVITETDKLRPQGKGEGGQLEVKSGKDIVTKFVQGDGKAQKGFLDRERREQEILEQLLSIQQNMRLPIDKRSVIVDGKKVTKQVSDEMLANQAYTNVKSLLNNFMEKGELTSTRSGLGQRYQTSLDFLAGDTKDIATTVYPTTGGPYKGRKETLFFKSLLDKAQETLKASGSTEKAKLLDDINNELDAFRHMGYKAERSDRSFRTPQIKATNKVRELTRKLAKGGLASRQG
jgi:hypothetical protein